MSADALVALARIHVEGVDECRLRSSYADIERAFWARADMRRGADACWPMLRARRLPGQQEHVTVYGTYVIAGFLMHASRVAIALSGRIFGSREEFACHECDNPPCINPRHLFIGAQVQNVRHFIVKNNRAVGAGRLSLDEVRLVRTAHAGGERDLEAVAARYGVQREAIRSIVNGRTWRLPEAFPLPTAQPSANCSE